MRSLNELVRTNILQLTAYSSARNDYKGTEGIFLDANENPFGTLNRYPDPQQHALKARLAAVQNLLPDQIFIGNGSDEVIDLCYRIFCRPGVDKAITFSPSYGMYEVSAAINDVQLIKVSLDDEFQIDLNLLKGYLQDETVKLIFICSPNNPTGNILNDVGQVLRLFSGIVIVDEAYIDFADAKSWITKLNEFPNLLVCQTMSKARGLAAARVGLAYGSAPIINLFNRVKLPYNVSGLNQSAALQALEDEGNYQLQKQILISERTRVAACIRNEGLAVRVFPSDANFLLVEVDDAMVLYEKLIGEKIITRNRMNVVKNCIRITIGTPDENDRLLSVWKSLFPELINK